MNDKFVEKEIKATEVLMTYDYDKFRELNGNRTVEQSRFNKIEASMLLKQLPIAILVNEKFEVIDGQGRLAVARKHNMPIWYYVMPGLTIQDCVTCNIYSTNWSSKDIIRSEAKNGNDDYQRLLEVMDMYGYNEPNIVFLASGTSSYGAERTKKLKSGMVSFTKKDAEYAIRRLRYAQDVVDAISPVIKVKQDFTLKRAVIRASKEEGYDHSRMIQVCRDNAYRYRNAPTVLEHLEQLASFYNRGKKKDFMDVYGSGGAMKISFRCPANRTVKGK